jgi:HEPN domain-containing protein
MGNVEQIGYWVNTANEDLHAADLLISNGKILHGLFFCHLSIEKIIKAHIVSFSGEIPPKSHNLLFLLSKTGLSLSEEEKDFCAILMNYQLEGRYPEYYPSIPQGQLARELLIKTKELFSCLKKKL